MKSTITCLSVFLFLLLSSCTIVPSTEPIGSKKIKLDKKDWNGLWKYSFEDLKENEERYLMIKVRNAEEGILNIGFIDSDSGGDEIDTDGDKNKFSIKNFPVMALEHKDYSFFNVRARDIENDGMVENLKKMNQENNYCWCFFVRIENAIFVYFPNKKFFKSNNLLKEIDLGNGKTFSKLTADSKTLSDNIVDNIYQVTSWKRPHLLLTRVR